MVCGVDYRWYMYVVLATGGVVLASSGWHVVLATGGMRCELQEYRWYVVLATSGMWCRLQVVHGVGYRWYVVLATGGA